mgnify:FL=1
MGYDVSIITTITNTRRLRMFINFDKIAKGQELRGGLTSLKIALTLLKLRYIDGHKPVIFRNKGVVEKGWFVRKGMGGISGEPLIRFNWGNQYSSFHAYDRKGKPRVSQNWYVAFKSRLTQKLVA